MNASKADEYLTVAEIASELKLNQQTIRNWIRTGSLRAVYVGPRRVRVLRSDLDRMLAGGATAPAADEQTPTDPLRESSPATRPRPAKSARRPRRRPQERPRRRLERARRRRRGGDRHPRAIGVQPAARHARPAAAPTLRARCCKPAALTSRRRPITGVTTSYLQIGCFLAAAAGPGRARVSTGAERP